MSNQNWEGSGGSVDHRTVGPHRAWCGVDSEWCSPAFLCRCCDVTRVPDQWKGMYAGEVLADLRARVQALPVLLVDAQQEPGRPSHMEHAVLLSDVLALLKEDDRG